MPLDGVRRPFHPVSEQRMKRNDGFVLQTVAEECLLIPIGARVIDMNGLVTLNATARFIWELLADERTLEELVAGVAAAFDVTPDCARTDVLAFVEEITALGLIQP